ncbi:MAG TPA: hypothetical protein VFC09_16690 [Candidatus Dormibacteraeota bacterium]|nr:hypothetical protein [Candidatus Dormibacteraeota bacterium]
MTPDPGLCATCRHAGPVRGARSTFWMCRLSATDPAFDRYPRLPVLRCRGWERGEPDAGGATPSPGREVPPP